MFVEPIDNGCDKSSGVDALDIELNEFAKLLGQVPSSLT